MSQVVPTKILDPDSLQRRTPCLDVDLAHRLTSKAEHVRWVIADLLPITIAAAALSGYRNCRGAVAE